MSKTLSYIIILLFTAARLLGQSQEPRVRDSLLKELHSVRFRNAEDTAKAKLLIRLSWNYTDIDPNKSIMYGQQALEVAVKLNWTRGKMLAYAALGDACARKTNNEKALDCYDKSLKVAEELGDSSGIAVALGNSAEVYFQMGDYKTALQDDFKVLKVFEQTGSKENYANVLNSIGNIYTEQGSYPQAMEYHLRALKLYEQLGSRMSIAKSYLNIANIFSDQNEYDKALENYNKSLKIDQALGYNEGIAGCFISMGDVLLHQHNVAGALELFQKAMKVPGALRDKDALAVLTSGVGDACFQQKDFARAMAFYQTTLKISAETGNRQAIAINANLAGQCLLALLNEKSEGLAGSVQLTLDPEISQLVPVVNIPAGKAAKLRMAAAYFRKGLDIATNINSLGVMQSALEGLAATSKANGDYKSALDYADKARILKDSVFSKENTEKILRLSMKYENDQQRLADSLGRARDLQASAFRLQQQRYAWYLSLVFFILVLSSAVIFFRSRMARAKAGQQAMFSRQLLETELKALRAQMNPHFIFNSLNSIQAFILKENKEGATNYLQKFSLLIRKILDNAQKASHTIEDETEILSLYLDLEQLRLKGKFDFEIKIAGELDASFYEIPAMVIQPLVENSIWHGLMHAPHKGLLTVEFVKDNNTLTCIVEDNGIGRDKAQVLKGAAANAHQSKGLKLIEDRLQAWSRVKNLQCGLKIFDNDGERTGTRTEITILYPYA